MYAYYLPSGLTIELAFSELIFSKFIDKYDYYAFFIYNLKNVSIYIYIHIYTYICTGIDMLPWLYMCFRRNSADIFSCDLDLRQLWVQCKLGAVHARSSVCWLECMQGAMHAGCSACWVQCMLGQCMLGAVHAGCISCWVQCILLSVHAECSAFFFSAC